MKRQLVFIAFIILAVSLVAKPRDMQEGLQIAEDFFIKLETTLGKQKSSTNQAAMKLLYNQKSSSNKDLFFVYGRTAMPGYVIVSADDRTYDVLGYSYENEFDADNIPENLAFWLKGYEQEILHLKDELNASEAKYTYERPQYTTFAVSVEPLLGGIKWDQGAPFNNLAPVLPNTQKAASGCVATAMAQLMKYYEWPQQGKGSKSYTTRTRKFKLEADFSSASYDWANMADVYSASTPQDQQDAVALLMYHCGVAVEMDYNQSSGAYSHDIAPAMIDYFSYDENMQLWSRDFYSYQEWLQLLKAEISASRPVLYGGVSDDGGHQFILDGYDTNDFFHVNWGWGGMSDGYFRVTALDPSAHGTGGGIGGFNYSQNMYVGIQKPSASSTKPVSQFNTISEIQYPTKSQDRTASINVALNRAFNYGVFTLNNLNLAYGFYDLDGERKAVVEVASVAEVAPLYGVGSAELKAKNGVPTDLEPGNYQMYIVYKSDADDDWLKLRYYAGNPSYTNVSLTETRVSFSTPSNEKPDLELIQLTSVGNLYKNKIGRFQLKLKNNGKDFNSDIALVLESVDNPGEYQFVLVKQSFIPEDGVLEVLLTAKIESKTGEYMLYVAQGEDNIPTGNTRFDDIGEGVPVTVQNLPLGSPQLELTSTISFPNNKKVHPENAELTANITNKGVFFDDDVVAFVLPAAGGNSLMYFGYQTLYLDQNETIELKFTGDIDLEPGEYLAGVFFYSTFPAKEWKRIPPNEYSLIEFELLEKTVDNVDALAGNLSLKLSPVPAKDFVNIESPDRIDAFEVYTMTGQMIYSQSVRGVNKTQINTSNWESGMYILHVRTSEGIQSKSFIVQ